MPVRVPSMQAVTCSAIGLPAGATGWEIELEDPRSVEDTHASSNVPPGAV